MSDETPQAEPGDVNHGVDAASSAADRRMAELLQAAGGNADLRRKLQDEDSAEASDILSRLNALDFVEQVVDGATAEVPEHVGGYEIKGVLGRGGMGVVYLGWQQELEREVALKVLSPRYTADPTMRKRFRAEARATAALHHRHIVPIYDYGESQGMLFFAMERVNGMSLDKHIAAARRVGKAPMEPVLAARRFAGVADALGLAHRRRLLHRDVKPGNILVGDDGTLALTDFGLAKALDHASMQLTSKSGGFLGTLHYASPEQALGRELTPASDLYSLGVTMFEAVTGQLPLAGKTTEALLQSILHGTPRRLRDAIAKPPRDLEAVLDKLLAREPGDRYQDGEALARDLQRIADGEPVHIRRLPLHVRLWRRARKNPVLTGAFVAVFMLVLATATLVGVLSREKGKGLVSRHENRLVAIAQDVGRERGSPWGPAPLLQALTGVAVPDEPVSSGILSALDAAHAEMPDDPRVAQMRRAYEQDPVPSASAYLAAGRGFEAMRLYDAAIQASVARRTGGSLAVELRLYRLYLGRGVARLTAAVARPNDARTDLALASYLRPGAVFPLALLDLLDVVQSANVPGAVARLSRELSQASAERVRVVSLLLWTAAGHAPPANANLMSFGLSFADRRAVQRLADELLVEPPGQCVEAGQPTGLARQFADACRKALDRLSDPEHLRSLVEQTTQVIVRSTHPESPLQGWRHVLQLLTQPRQRGPLLDDAGEPLSASMQLAAWRAFVQLQPRGSLLRLWLVRFEEFRRDHPGLVGLVEVAARMHLLAGSPDVETWADRWVAQANGDPAAHLCRMQARLLAGRVPEAQDDAIVAVQASIEPARTLQRVVQLLLQSARAAEPGVLEEIRMMVDRFRQQVDAAAVHAGGGR